MKKCLLLITVLYIFSSGAVHAGSYETGMNYYIHKNYEKANESLLEAVKGNPKNGNAWYFLGEIEKNSNNYKTAEEYYRNAVDGNIDAKYKKMAYWNIVVLTEQRGNINEVAKSCKEFYEHTGSGDAKKKINDIIDKLLWTTNETAQELYKKGSDQKSNGQKEEAFNSFKAAVAEDSSFLAPRFEIGMYYMDKKDISGAILNFKMIADKIPFYTSANRLLADLYFNSGTYSSCVTYYSNCLEYGMLDDASKYTCYLRKGTAHFKMRDYTSAEPDITEASKLKTKSTEPLYILSAIYIDSNRYPEALTILTRLEKLNPEDPMVMFQTGSIYYKMQDDKYADEFDRLYNLVKTKSLKKDPYLKAFAILAKYHASKKSYKRAAEIIEILPDNQKNYELRLVAARSSYENRDYDKSIQYLEGVSLNQDDKILLASAYIKSGRRDKCKTILNEFTAPGAMQDKILQNSSLKGVMQEILKENEARQKELNKPVVVPEVKPAEPINKPAETKPDPAPVITPDSGGAANQ